MLERHTRQAVGLACWLTFSCLLHYPLACLVAGRTSRSDSVGPHGNPQNPLHANPDGHHQAAQRKENRGLLFVVKLLICFNQSITFLVLGTHQGSQQTTTEKFNIH